MRWAPTVLLAALLLAASLPADDKAPEGPPMTIIDVAGKQQKIKSWAFTHGTRRLGWLADAADQPPSKEKGKRRPPRKVSVGPEAVVIRDAGKFNFAEGVLALVPLTNVRAIDFNSEKKQMTIKAAVSGKPEEDVELTGSTAYKMLNKVTVEADVDKGALGVASVTYQGGVARGGIRGLRLDLDKVEAPKPGRAAVVETADKDLKSSYKVTDLKPLYRLEDGREVLSPTLLFKKTLRLDVNKVAKIVTSTEDSDDTVWSVTPKDGEEGTLTLLTTGTIEEQSAVLVGLVGRVPFGYRLFPIRRITSIHFDAAEVPKETLLRMPRPLEEEKK